MDTPSKRETLSVFVFGGYESGKSTFINSICEEFGSVILQQTMPSTLGCLGCGLYQVDVVTDVILYEMRRDVLDIMGIAGKWSGVIVVVDHLNPETIRDAHNAIAICRAYLPLPLVVIDNAHRKDVVTRQSIYLSDDSSMSDADLRFALQLPDDSPLVKCDVSDPSAAKAILHDLIQTKANPKRALSLPPETHIRSEQELFIPGRSHRFLVVVGTEFWYAANYFMEMAADQVSWVSLDKHKIPRRWGLIDLDSVHLHIIPVEHFGFPTNNVSAALESFMALIEGKKPPTPEIKGELVLTEGTIGCIGIFNSGDELSVVRTQHLINVIGDFPYLMIDTWQGQTGQRGPSGDPIKAVDEAGLGSRHAIMRVEKLNKSFPRLALCILNEQLTGIEAEKLRTKFDCL